MRRNASPTWAFGASAGAVILLALGSVVGPLRDGVEGVRAALADNERLAVAALEANRQAETFGTDQAAVHNELTLLCQRWDDRAAVGPPVETDRKGSVVLLMSNAALSIPSTDLGAFLADLDDAHVRASSLRVSQSDQAEGEVRVELSAAFLVRT